MKRNPAGSAQLSDSQVRPPVRHRGSAACTERVHQTGTDGENRGAPAAGEDPAGLTGRQRAESREGGREGRGPEREREREKGGAQRETCQTPFLSQEEKNNNKSSSDPPAGPQH